MVYDFNSSVFKTSVLFSFGSFHFEAIQFQENTSTAKSNKSIKVYGPCDLVLDRVNSFCLQTTVSVVKVFCTFQGLRKYAILLDRD